MTTIIEYAQLSAHVYAATPRNSIPVPTDWTELEWIPDRWNGFSAGVYKNGSDIVIAFTGTNGQKTADFGWANLLAATGAPSPQVTEAMLLYFQVKQANPTANITFTGHSLGGGIATMMGIFFDRPATVFDAAPFELGARNLASLAVYKATTSAAGYSDPAFDAYWAAAPTVFYAREPQVKNTFLKGEFLESGRTALTEIGTSTPVDVGTPTNVSAFNQLHSMTLLASMLTSSAFATVVRANPSLISTLFDQSLYASNAETSVQRDFLTSLYSTQVRPTGSIPLLDRFAADLQRLGTQGVTARTDWQKALTVAAMDYYYNKEASTATQFFKLESGGLHFNLDDIGVSTLKSLTLLRTAASSTAIGADPFNVGNVSGAKGWHVQSGEGSMNWAASKDADDVAIGGAQGDVLRAGSGSDYVVGGADDIVDACEGGLSSEFHTEIRHAPLISCPLLRTEDPMTTTINPRDDFTQPCRRTRRASVPTRLRARGRGDCGTRLSWLQHRGWRAHSAATANWLQRSGTATRHVCGLGWRGEEDQAQQVHSMRVVSTKWLGRRMNRASSTSNDGVPA